MAGSQTGSITARPGSWNTRAISTRLRSFRPFRSYIAGATRTPLGFGDGTPLPSDKVWNGFRPALLEM